MDNIISYLEKYGKYTLEEKPFNEVDNVCISYMIYADIEKYFSVRKEYSLKELAALLFFDHDENELKKSNSLVAQSPFVLKAMAKSNRFKNAILTNYVVIEDDSKDENFCVGELKLSDGTSYIAFRGTKNTLISWKESFTLIYKKTASHTDAYKYIKKHIKKDRMYRLGGHSKGGTLAIYAALLNNDLHSNILKVYSNDGPGLNPKILPTNYHKLFKTLDGKYTKIIPEFDIFGTIFSSSRKKRVVKSSGIALMQHDPILWKVNGNKFVSGKQLKRVDVLRKAFEDLVNTISDKEFEQFIDSYASLLKKNGVDNIMGGLNGMLPLISVSLGSIKTMSDNSKKVITSLGKLLLKESTRIN